MHPKPAGSQQEFPFQFWRGLVRSHRLVLVPTAVRALWHLPKEHGRVGATKWRMEVRNLVKGSGVPQVFGREGKKSSRISEGVSFRSKTSHVTSFLVKEKQIHSGLGQKKSCLQAFSIQLFPDETIIVKLYIKKNSFWKCQIKIFLFLKAWQQFVILTRSSHWDEYALVHALLFCFSNG